MKQVTKYILSQLAAKNLSEAQAVQLLKELKSAEPKGERDIAVIGMSCRLPMAQNPEEFWDNLISGRNCFVAKPACKRQGEKVIGHPLYADLFEVEPFHKGQENLEDYVAPYIEDVDRFDAKFFNILPREAQCIDPAQRVFLELAWAAIEDAGYSTEQMKNTLTGVYVGKDYSNPSHYHLITAPDPLKSTGTWEGFLASRMNYFLNLRGPSMVIDTACSSGMVALHQACHALRNGECEMALVGGVAIGCGGEGKKESGELSAVGAVSSKDNRVRTFDDKCSGSVFGEGVAVVMLKPLKNAMQDGDQIYGVIKGSAINNDGTSSGISAPNPLAQEALIVQAWKNAGVNPETINYVEAHGTGTKLGDPIEITGLDNALRKYTRKKQFCGIGSAKTNIGHLVAASGLAGLIKVLLSLKHECIPASLNFAEPNRHIDFCNSGLYVVDRPTPWKASDTPRRAGINSFGLSGTNCHVIIEQAPTREPSAPVQRQEAVCFSAKSQASLRGLLEDYCAFLSKNAELSVRDIAYTANTGRGHYAWRAAILADSAEQLREKIQNLLNHALSPMPEEGIFCGMHKIVAEGRNSYAEGELTEAQALAYTRQAEEAGDNLPLLCRNYTLGASVVWKNVYPNGYGRRISLPTYHFERTLCWAEPKKAPEAQQISAAISTHISRCLAQSMDLELYALRFSLQDDWVLQEHKIAGNHIVPGTVYIDMLTQLGQKLWGSGVCIDSLLFLTPLVVGAEGCEAQLKLQREGDAWKLQVLSCQDGTWHVHCEGRFAPLAESTGTVDVAALLQERGEEYHLDISQSDGETAVGLRWSCCKALHACGDAYLLEIELPEAYAEDLRHYRYHPAMADVAVNLAAQLNYRSHLYLPLQYTNLRVYRPLPRRFYCHYRPLTAQSRETFRFAVQMFDGEGQLLAQAEEYATKRVEHYQSFFANRFYATVWQKQTKPAAQLPAQKTALFCKEENSELAEALEAYGCTLIHVAPSAEFTYLDATHYTVAPNVESYANLLRALAQGGCTRILHAWNLEGENGEDESIRSAFCLAKAAGAQTHFFDVVFVAKNAQRITGEEREICPQSAAFLAMAKSIPDELGCMSLRAVDTDVPCSAALVQELLAERSERMVALRDETVYTPVLTELRNVEEAQFAPQDGGVYLIAGGSGGLGLEIAKWLAKNGASCLHLLGRRALTDAQEEKQQRLQKTIQELQETCSVCYHAVDVADAAAMEELGRSLQEERLDGIFQCAGVAGKGMLLTKEESRFREVLSPKMEGTWNLHKLPVSPKHFVLFSSIQTLFGGAGQCDYVAANAFLDAFADYRHSLGLPATVINWPAWKQVGMAADMHAADARSFFHALSPDRAISALETILAAGLSGVIPGKLDEEFLAQEQAHFPIAIEEALRPKTRGEGKQKARQETEILLLGKEPGGFTAREREIAQIYARTIGLSEIDVFDSINAMGGDSIVSMEILKALNQRYGNHLSAADMFTYASVSDMAAHIETMLQPV